MSADELRILNKILEEMIEIKKMMLTSMMDGSQLKNNSAGNCGASAGYLSNNARSGCCSKK